MKTPLPLLATAMLLMQATLCAQHEHGGSTRGTIKPPKIFLDKSPRIVAYQLNRLSNEQLLLVERRSDDKRYAPVYQAILSREGISRGYRDEALAALASLNHSDPVRELASNIETLAAESSSSQQTIQTLTQMLLSLAPADLRNQREALQALVGSQHALSQRAGYAAMLQAGGIDEQAWEHASHVQQLPELLSSIRQLPTEMRRAEQQPRVAELARHGQPLEVQIAALDALAYVPAGQAETFRIAAELVTVAKLRPAAVRAMLSVPKQHRGDSANIELIEWLVDFAENTPAAQRTSNDFFDAMELVDQLIASAGPEQARSFRERLRETVVRVVRIHTVEEEMRYDLPYFAVEAGRPVQLVLINDDIMPHNLVITTPGKLQEVAELGLQVGPDNGADGKQYVPATEDVLFATHMVPAGERTTLTFTAPTSAGEYPYVCTFPRHWMRMYGVMVVVDDLDSWLKAPVTPQDPIGSNRHFVQSWTVDDFGSDLADGLRGRLPRIGEKLFTEATCAQCHKLGEFGQGNVGPDLSQAFERRKNDAREVLREILDPSHRIDEQYAVHLIQTVDGQVVSGLVVEETKDFVLIRDNPEAANPVRIETADIEQRIKTSNSMMPKGLLDRFSQDEILEILGFIAGKQTAKLP